MGFSWQFQEWIRSQCLLVSWLDNLGNPSSILLSVWVAHKKRDDGGAGLGPQMSENSLDVLHVDGCLSSPRWKCQRKAAHTMFGPVHICCGLHSTQVHWNLLPGTFSPQVASIDKEGQRSKQECMCQRCGGSFLAVTTY